MGFGTFGRFNRFGRFTNPLNLQNLLNIADLLNFLTHETCSTFQKNQMHFNISQHLPANFHPDSRVWIYQSNRLFTSTESAEITLLLNDFASNWTSHGAKVKGFATILLDTFILFLADETATGVSGCSTDSSVKLVKEIEKKFEVELFNRQRLAFWVDENIFQIPLNELKTALDNEVISPETLYFNNTILSKKELEQNWLIKLKNSWLGLNINS